MLDMVLAQLGISKEKIDGWICEGRLLLKASFDKFASVESRISDLEKTNSEMIEKINQLLEMKNG